MKIKTTFVTNSSTTSFVVMGSIIDFSEFFKNNKEKLYEYYKKEINEDEELVSLEDFNQNDLEYEDEALYSLNKSKALSINYNYDSENVYIGIPYTSMGEDETLKEFKERTKKEIKDNFNIDINPHHIEEAWSDY